MTLSDLEKEFNTGSMARDSWLGRFHSEIKYAEGLCDIHPGKASKWRKLISQACAIVGSAANKSTGNYKSAVKKAEAVLEPIAKVAKTYHVHCIGHGHIDMNWRWSWQETVAVTNDTFTTALRLMDEFPDFRYSQSQSAVYALIKQYNPELMDRIREKIKSGQWEHTASHWVEGDKNMAGTEAMCRQVLYARQFAKDEFGLEPEDVPVDWQPDSFGHSHGVPGYLNESGIKYYYFTRLGTIGPCPPVFHWKGLNGSTVLAHHAETYNGYMTSAFIGKFITYSKESGLKNFCHSYGVGNHGGGPTRTNILAIYEMDSWPVFPNMKMSTAKNYFESIEAEKVDIPTIDRELNYFAQGCYTSNDRIKRWNRIAESRLPDAEAAATLDWALLGSSYPTASLTKAWQDTLFGHFHDILPGCNQDISQDYTSGKFQETMATTAMVETNALRRIAAEVDTSGDDVVLEPNTPALYRRESAGNGAGFGSEEGMISQFENTGGGWPRKALVYNPTGHPRQELAMMTVWETDMWCQFREMPMGDPDFNTNLPATPFSIRTPSGKIIPAQVIDAQPYWMTRCARLAFPIEELAAGGYSIYTCFPEEAKATVKNPVSVKRMHQTDGSHDIENHGWQMSNSKVSIQISNSDGLIHSMVETATKREFAEQPLGRIEICDEKPMDFSAWEIGERRPAEDVEVTNVSATAHGPYIARIATEWRFRDSKFTTTYELRHNDPKIYIRIEGLWREWGDEVKGMPAMNIAFPLNLENIKPRYEIPFGSIVRDTVPGVVVPTLRWTMLTGKQGKAKAGLLILNHCKHGQSVTDNIFRVDLLRASYWPDPLPEAGEHTMELSIQAFADAPSEAEACQAAQTITQPLRVCGTDSHKGTLPADVTAFELSMNNVIVSAFKKAEGRDAFVIRLIETAGKKAQGSLSINKESLGNIVSVEQADIIERPKGKKLISKKNKIFLKMNPFEIATLIIETEK